MPEDYEITLGGTRIAVRELGATDGVPILHFHGTPGSRLELEWAADQLRRAGVRVITFDRPGYGRSPAIPFSLTRVARMALELLDASGVERCATLGWSGGGPFALATAAAAPDRVTAVGVMAGAGPFQLIPGALASLSPDDADASRSLASDPAGAAAMFQRGFARLLDLPDPAALLAAFAGALSDRDRRVLAEPRVAGAFLSDLREAGLQGFAGGGWDNVAWIGEWDFDPSTVTCPVLLWYGDEDRMATPEHPRWLVENLPDATLTVRAGYGHFAPVEHLAEMVGELLRAADRSER